MASNVSAIATTRADSGMSSPLSSLRIASAVPALVVRDDASREDPDRTT